jgi:hypothetical protein
MDGDEGAHLEETGGIGPVLLRLAAYFESQAFVQAPRESVAADLARAAVLQVVCYLHARRRVHGVVVDHTATRP